MLTHIESHVVECLYCKKRWFSRPPERLVRRDFAKRYGYCSKCKDTNMPVFHDAIGSAFPSLDEIELRMYLDEVRRRELRRK